MKPSRPLISVGRIAGPFGVKGWVKVSSFTHPEENLFAYAPWTLRDKAGQRNTQTLAVLESKVHGKSWVAKLEGSADRDTAEALKGLEIVIDRSQMPEPEDGQYYWADLEGLTVENQAGQVLGQVDQLLETGSSDVMVVVAVETGERHLVPFIMGQTVTAVDLGAGCIRVAWDDGD